VSRESASQGRIGRIALSTALIQTQGVEPFDRVGVTEILCRSLGKNVYAYKMQSLIIGGVLGCLGGFIYALGQASIQPDIFGTDTTFFAYTSLILGGAARVGGPVVGAMIFWVILSLSDNILNEARTTQDRGDHTPGEPRDHGTDAHTVAWWEQGAQKNRTVECNTWLATPAQVS